VPLITRFEGRAYPALALALVNCCNRRGKLALADGGPMRVVFQRDWNAYTVVSAVDILDQAIDPASARGRLVLVGSSSLGMGDRVATPLAASRPAWACRRRCCRPCSTCRPGCPGALAGPPPRAGLGPADGAAGAARLPAPVGAGQRGPAGRQFAGLDRPGVARQPHDPDFSPVGRWPANLFLLASRRALPVAADPAPLAHLLLTLRQYVAPAVVAELLRSDLEDPLQPRQLDVTTLIADMEGYTAQVESLPVEEAARLTRDFLDCLTGPVIERQGTLDKYTGDGLVAFWGAPLPVDQHADLALDAAREIVARVRVFSARANAPAARRCGCASASKAARPWPATSAPASAAFILRWATA
jgi:adenylate cyclase